MFPELLNAPPLLLHPCFNLLVEHEAEDRVVLGANDRGWVISMSNVSYGIDLLIGAAQDYSAARLVGDIAHLKDLELFVRVREAQAMTFDHQAMIVLEVTAASNPAKGGITITCVGYAEDTESAVKEAVGHWRLGVLPVLARWRGEANDFATIREIGTKSGQFLLVAGPTVTRGIEKVSASASEFDVSFVDALIPLEEAARPAPRAHWMEMFACKFADGSVDATCRFNNHDFLAAKKVLLDIAAKWSPPATLMKSQRQFAMLLPKDFPATELVLPTMWDRLLGKA